MKTMVAMLLILFGFAGAAQTTQVPGWECSLWADHVTYYLACGGATLGGYKSAQACVDARKQICGPANSDYECQQWPDGTYNLYCGTAYIANYKTALACIQGKRKLCD
jgi:hypothetical protein